MPHDITVYVKAAEDGHSRGDCPFCQKVCMWLQLKGIEHTETFINMKDKPDWFMDMAPAGLVPVVKVDDKVVADSEAIIDYLEKHTPAEPDLTCTDVSMDVCKDIMSVFKEYYFNEEANKESKKKVAFDRVMVELHEYLDSIQHPWLSADHPTRADCALIPKLYHALTVLENAKKYKIPPDAPEAQAYVTRAFKLPEFKGTAYPKEVILHSWAQKHKQQTHKHHHDGHHKH